MDTNGDDYYVLVCDSGSTAVPDSGGSAPSCSGTQYAVSLATTSGDAITPITFDTTDSSSESYDWIAFVCDDNSPSLCSSSSTGNSPFKVNHAPVIGTVTAGASYGSNASVDPGETIYFQVAVTDGDTDTASDTVDMYICSSVNFTPGTGCDDTTYCTDTAVASGGNAQCNDTDLIPIPTAHGTTYPFYVFLDDGHDMGDGGTGGSNTYSVTDIAPSVTGYTATDVPTPSAGGNNGVSFTAVVYDPNGEGDITGVEGVFFDPSSSGVGNTGEGTNACVGNERNCYIDSACNISNTAYGTGAELEASCSVTVWFNANASDWDVQVKPSDEQGQVTSASNAGVSLANIALQGIDIVQTGIAYGGVEIGGTSSSVETSMGNVGNQVLDVFLDGTLMCTDYPTCIAYTIPIAQQKWFHTSNTFDWDAEATGAGPYPLVGTASGTGDATGCLNRDIAVRNGNTGVDDHTDVTTNESIYWKLRIPSTQNAGSYTGSNTFTSALGSVCSTGDAN